MDNFEFGDSGLGRMFDSPFFKNGGDLWSSFPRLVVEGGALKSDYFVEGDEMVLNVDVAGSTAKDVNVDYDTANHMLSVLVSKQYEKKENKPAFYIRERTISERQRSYQLPHEVNEDTIVAEIKNGLLTVRAKLDKVLKEETNMSIKVIDKE